MRCHQCQQEITYDPPTTNKGHGMFWKISYHEMFWGEHSIYPFQVETQIFCSIGCLIDWCRKRK
jgi:hypothetical protein